MSSSSVVAALYLMCKCKPQKFPGEQHTSEDCPVASAFGDRPSDRDRAARRVRYAESAKKDRWVAKHGSLDGYAHAEARKSALGRLSLMVITGLAVWVIVSVSGP